MRLHSAKYLSVCFAAGSLLLLSSGPGAMAQDRPADGTASPASVPLSRFKEFKDPAGWLKRQLGKKGFGPGQFTIDGQRVVTADPAVMRYLHRVVAFLWYRADTNKPLIHVRLRDREGKEADCVTVQIDAVIDGFDRRSFDREVFTVESLAQPTIQRCLVRQPANASYQRLSRAAFLAAYFDKHGLRRQHQRLRSDPRFILTALQHGWYAYTDCVSGNLRVTDRVP